MDRKRLAKRLEKLGYTLGKDIFGWVVYSDYFTYNWKFPTLGGVKRFLQDEENLSKYGSLVSPYERVDK